MNAISRRLLFWSGSIGFCLNLDDLVEIREKVADSLDPAQADPSRQVVGGLSFRRTMIPVVDLAGPLKLPRSAKETALVLGSSEGNWALLVDRVEGFVPSSELQDRPVPRLLQSADEMYFSEVSLYQGRPFVRLDLSACYARASD